MNRKEFLLKSGLTAISLTTLGSVILSKDGDMTGDCETTKDILGPFYRPDAPVRSDLLFEGLAGNRIEVQGNVFTNDCKTPLKEALVEIWQCDTEGVYDNDTDAYRLRARWITDATGAYSFLTVLPGKYLNGKLYRPAHIHFRVSAPDHKELISQIYFQGDPHIKEDPWASSQKAQQRILPLIPENTHGNLIVRFDIHLDKA